MKNLMIIFFTGCCMLAIAFGISNLVNTIVPEIKSEYENNSLFRAFSDPLMLGYYAIPILSAAILFWLWGFTKVLIKGDTFVSRGIYFGFLYWAITLPGIFLSYSSFQVSLAMVISWSLTTLIQSIFAGIVYSRIKP